MKTLSERSQAKGHILYVCIYMKYRIDNPQRMQVASYPRLEGEGREREKGFYRGHELCVALKTEPCLGKSTVGPKLRGIVLGVERLK